MTICALATAPGGAIGIIRISGLQTLEILSHVFSKNLTDAKPYTIYYGHIKDGSEVIDEVLVSIFRAPHSYTGEESAEISCHGSRYILNKVLNLLIENGCRQANPGEFTQRAYLNGKMDLSQAEAVADLIASSNRATHQIALSQLRGHFSSELGTLREQLLKLTSLLELELDFSDHEDLEFANRNELYQLAKIIDNRITRLARSFETGQAIKQGIPVAIVGKTNVGKSTLLNQLLHDDRAIVSNIHGTTRDTIEDTIDIRGITFRFIDTAGIRLIIVVNKIDKNDSLPYATISNLGLPTIRIAAKYGQGIDELEQAIFASANIPALTDTDIIVSNARHYNALVHAHESILRVIEGMEQDIPGDLLAEDLRLTINHLAEITGGQITPNEVLGNIFKNFCVGK